MECLDNEIRHGKPPGRATLSVTSCLRLQYLTRFSKPAADRILYRAAHQQPPRRILEVGIGTAGRALRILEVIAMHGPVGPVSYTGVDLFESRTAAHTPGLTLKKAHQVLRSTGAKIRLLPGDPFSVFSRHANMLGTFDFVLISAEPLDGAWFYLPRMLEEECRVFWEESCGGTGGFREVSMTEIQKLACAGQRRRAA